jgi:hypothetical protein
VIFFFPAKKPMTVASLSLFLQDNTARVFTCLSCPLIHHAKNLLSRLPEVLQHVGSPLG